MATRNKVVLTFAGDTSSLDKAAERVARSTKKMGDDFDKLNSRVAKKLPETFTTQFSSAASMALKAVPAQVQGAAVVAGTAIGSLMAAAAGAAVTAGILLAVGGGVLAAGIAASLKSSRVDELLRGRIEMQGTGLGRQGTHRPPVLEEVRVTEGAIDRIKKKFAVFGTLFEQPMVNAIRTFEASLTRMAPTINLMGASLAPVISKLAPALATMAERALPGIEKAAVASIPLFEKLAEHGPALGDAINRFFTLIAEGGPGATKFFDHLLTVIEISLNSAGIGFRFLSNEYLRFVNLVNSTKKFFSDVGSAISSAFRSAFGSIITAWNNTVGRINVSLPAWLPGIGGNRFAMPKFHQGGIVSGAMGQETLAVLQAGERVTPRGGGGGSTVLRVEAGDSGTPVDRAMAEIVLALLKKGALSLKVDATGAVVGA